MNSFVIENLNKFTGCRTCLIDCVEAHSKKNKKYHIRCSML